jgi:hypothetical protein
MEDSTTTKLLMKPIEGPVAWKGDAMARTRDWAVYMSQAGLEEIDRALRRFRDSNRTLETMRKEDFEIPTLAPLLRDVAKELENGRGFVQLKGLPVDRYSLRDAEIAERAWGAPRARP